MNNENILLKENQLGELISSLEKRISDIKNRFDEIKSKTTIVDGDSEIWRSKAQQSFKNKKDGYVKYFEVILDELNAELELLKLAKLKFRETEDAISRNVDYLINEIV